MDEFGLCEGDTCGRDGCEGTIIKDTESEGCSCHISAPCSYCHCEVQCDECNYASRDEEKPEFKLASPSKWMDDFYKQKLTFDRKLKDSTYEFEKVEWKHESHSNSSMKKIGGYPRGMDRGALIKELNGTFGGRFESLSENRFVFIAYTD